MRRAGKLIKRVKQKEKPPPALADEGRRKGGREAMSASVVGASPKNIKKSFKERLSSAGV